METFQGFVFLYRGFNFILTCINFTNWKNSIVCNSQESLGRAAIISVWGPGSSPPRPSGAGAAGQIVPVGQTLVDIDTYFLVYKSYNHT